MRNVYEALPTNNSIRLLHLWPGDHDTLLKAELVTHDVDQAEPYEALSYVWGDPDDSETLLIGDKILRISTNLHTIVTQLRSPNRGRLLWIDAICIDQQNDFEKGTQVALMGQIYQKATTVLCWLGNTSVQRTLAMRFLEDLASRADQFIAPDQVQGLWAISWEQTTDSKEASSVVAAAVEARVDTICDSTWFTRLWITQEVSLAKFPVILCGKDALTWRSFELGMRVLASCMTGTAPHPQSLRSLNRAWKLVIARAKHSLNLWPRTARPLVPELDQQWLLGRVAWELRHQNCKDDKDRVYALLSLVSTGNRLGIYVPKPFVPDYTRTVEWAYGQFWARYGGYTSLFYAGISRRRKSASGYGLRIWSGEAAFRYDENMLPSWCPDLRPDQNAWKPVFSCNFAASTPLHHMSSNTNQTGGPGPLMIRGHRLDTVQFGFRIVRPFAAREKVEDLMDLRDIIKMLICWQFTRKSSLSEESYINALGRALITDMPAYPDNLKHPLQKYLGIYGISEQLNNEELMRIWRFYIKSFLFDNGSFFTNFQSKLTSCLRNPEAKRHFRYDPRTNLPRESLLGWIMHDYLGNVLQKHRFIVTNRGWMGLAPPDTVPGDVVVVLGGPGMPFVVRDTAAIARNELKAMVYTPTMGALNGLHCQVVPSETGTNVSVLIGPCYIQGIMHGELFSKNDYKDMLEWEKDRLGSIPKPTICLV